MSESPAAPFTDVAQARPVFQESPAPPPAAAAPAAALARPAGFWIRFVAVAIDFLVWCVLQVGAKALVRLAAGVSLQPLWSESLQATPLLNSAELAVCLVWGWMYMAGLESSARQGTLGKMAVSVRVTDLLGRRIGFARATGRHFAKALSILTLFVGFVMAAFTPARRALHDFVAGTRVIRS